jgi:hypothetical protein
MQTQALATTTQSHQIELLKSALKAAALLLIAAVCGVPTARAADDAKPFIGHWALTIPGGGAGWLGVTEKDGQLQASLLWGGGSVLPVASATLEGDELVLVRGSNPAKKSGKAKGASAEKIIARVSGDTMNLTQIRPSGDKAEFSGKRIPPVGPTPDLTKIKFGSPIKLFNGKDLTGWKLMNPKAPNGWSVKDGVLMNRAVQEEGKPHKSYTNISTEQQFEDFNITLETRVFQGGNSGIYLRGIYEIQVAETYGKPLDPHNMGALYSRLCPTVAAEKPAGEWQTLDITLVDRHLTVILNGKKIIDNQPVLGCTGGALWSDEFRPGPIYLQGDHTDVDYRNIVLRPVVK